MNCKEKELNVLLDIVTECCVVDNNGRKSLVGDDIRGASRCQDIVMTRCIFCDLARLDGFSVDTIAFYLNRTTQSIRHLIKISTDYQRTSRVYRIAYGEANEKYKNTTKMSEISSFCPISLKLR